MIGSPYIIGGAAILSGIVGTYAGSQIEHGRHVSRELKAVARIEKAKVRIESAVNLIASNHGAASVAQQIETREIYREAIRIVDRPVYRNQCVDADGLQLLDRARANANRGLAGVAPDSASETAGDTAQP